VFHYLQTGSKLLAQLGGLIYKLRLLLRFIMTRIMTNPELISPVRKPPERQEIWFIRDALALPNVTGARWTSDILRTGTIIREVKIQARSVVPDTPLAVGGFVFLTSSKMPGPTDFHTAEHVILWSEDPRNRSWFSIGQFIDESWLLRKIVTGSDLRLCIQLQCLTVGGVDIRVGVRYDA